jgi:hypothetical protein
MDRATDWSGLLTGRASSTKPVAHAAGSGAQLLAPRHVSLNTAWEGAGPRAEQSRPARYAPSAHAERKPNHQDASLSRAQKPWPGHVHPGWASILGEDAGPRTFSPTSPKTNADISSGPRPPHAQNPTDSARSSQRPPSNNGAAQTSPGHVQPGRSHASASVGAGDAVSQGFSPTSSRVSLPGEARPEKKSRGVEVPKAPGHGATLLAAHGLSAHPSGEAARERARYDLQQKQQKQASRREPRARTASATKASTSSARRGSSQKAVAQQPKQPSPQRKAKEPISCTNNAKSPELLQNGGVKRLGSPSQCVQKGFGAALYQEVKDVHAFIRKFDAPYEKLIELQKVWFKKAEPPPGWQRATLPMCFQKGFGAGTAALARKLKKEMSGRGEPGLSPGARHKK